MSRPTLVLCAIAGPLTLIGCADPLSRDSTESLREQIIKAQREEVRAAGDPGARAVQPAEEEIGPFLGDQPGRRELLDEISGPAVRKDTAPEMDLGLDEEPSDTVSLSLRHALRVALRRNLDLRIAQLRPAISQTEVVAAEAAFDAVFFTNAGFSSIDQPRTVPIVQGPSGEVPTGTPLNVTDRLNLDTGIRKPLETGGEISVSTGIEHTNNQTPDLRLTPDPATTSTVSLNISQPLLRNFGTLVNRAQIQINRNARRQEVLNLFSDLLDTLGQVEQTYWQLVFSRRRLAIQQELLDRNRETLRTLQERAEFDVNPVQLAQARAFLEQRRSEVIRARQQVRQTSDQLKRLMNDPELPVSGETLIVPTDDPVTVPVEYDLVDAVTTALQRRPEVNQALVEIDSAAIRQAVADNQRLPVLDLNATIEYRGLESGVGSSYEELGEGQFIDYILQGQFEAPIGNRAAEARHRRARIQRQLNVYQYRKTVQEVVQNVKDALRNVRSAWQQIGVNRTARRAAAENLRALQEREEKGEALTPEFLLDLKLQTQQRLANAQISELQAMVDYNIALTNLYQASGTLLKHNQIEMNWPEGIFAGNGETDWTDVEPPLRPAEGEEG